MASKAVVFDKKTSFYNFHSLNSELFIDKNRIQSLTKSYGRNYIEQFSPFVWRIMEHTGVEILTELSLMKRLIKGVEIQRFSSSSIFYC